MTDKAQPPVESGAVDKLATISLLARFLGILERVLPAFLVAWNNQLRQRSKELELKVGKLEADARIAAHAQKQKDSNNGKDSAQIISDFLDPRHKR